MDVSGLNRNTMLLSVSKEADSLPLIDFRVDKRPTLRDGKVDNRFTSLGLSISEYEIEAASGVLVSTNKASVVEKQKTFYEFWARPTTPVSLGCEEDDLEKFMGQRRH